MLSEASWECEAAPEISVCSVVSAPQHCTVMACSVLSERDENARIPVFLALRTGRIDFCKVGSLSGPVSWFFASQKQFLFLYDYLLLQFKNVDMAEWISLYL